MEKAIAAGLDKNLFTWEIQYTRYARHGTALAAAAAAGRAYAVIAVGGDGSINDILNGLRGTDTVLGILPKGSGNGMARTLGIPLNDAQAIAVLNRCKEAAVDIGYANDQLFISNAGVAFDALISRKFSLSKRRGLLAYSWLVTRYLWTYRPQKWRIRAGNGKEREEEAFIVCVANGRQFGYDFSIAPDADWRDGLLDLVIIRPFPKIYGLLLAWRLWKGTILQSRYVSRMRVKTVSISHPQLKELQTDGDINRCAPRVNFHIEPGAQRVLVP